MYFIMGILIALGFIVGLDFATGNMVIPALVQQF